MTNLKPPFDSSLWNKFKNYIYEKYGQESGKMLVHAGVITWITATASQVAAVMINKEIPSEQKKFLIPQEIADGALNVLAFYTVTSTMKNIAGKLASTGKWSTNAIRTFVEKYNKTATDKIVMGNIKNTNLGVTFKEDKEFRTSYDSFKGGLDMIAATVGSVVSCNLVTPVIRNSWGAKQQKQSIANDRARQQMQKNTATPLINYASNRSSMKV